MTNKIIRYIILIGLVIVACVSVGHAQILQPRSSKYVQVQDARFQATLNLILPRYADTAHANSNVGLDSLGALIYVGPLNQVYYRDSTAGHRRWLALASGTPSLAFASITGLPTDNAALSTALSTKQNVLTTGTSAQYFRGDLSLATFPTNVSSFTNDAGYITSAVVGDTNSIVTTATNKVNLSGDVSAPGATKYYGTNSGGTKGWYTLSTGGGSGTVTQVNSGAGLTGGPITGVGTLAIDSVTSAGVITKTVALGYEKYSDTASQMAGYTRRVYGTANRITSTGGQNPVIDLSATLEALFGHVANRIDQNNAATTSAQFASVISDELGTGKLIFVSGNPLANQHLVYDGTNYKFVDSLNGNAYIVNGLTFSGGDSIYSGGTFIRNTHYSGSNLYNVYFDSTNVLFTGTGYIQLPKGNTAQRPGSPVSGMIRYNTDSAGVEGYNGSIWRVLGSGSGGGSSPATLQQNYIGVGNSSNILNQLASFRFDGTILTVGAMQSAYKTSGSSYMVTDSASLASTLPNNTTTFGYKTWLTAATGARNTGFGDNIFQGGVSGTDNSFFGHNGFNALTFGNDNTGMGSGAGNAITTGSFNTLFGFAIGQAITTGFKNIQIGSKLGANPLLAATSNRNIYIGNDSVASTPALVYNSTYIGHSFQSIRSNVAVFGTNSQVISLGNGGMSTAAYTALGTTATAGDWYYNTDSSDYIRYTTVWSKIGGGSGGSYTLPTASGSTLGGVKIDGTTITILSGVISAAIPRYATSTALNTANYTVPLGARIYFELPDLTGQANRNVILPSGVAGNEYTVVNTNTPASGFAWTFTSRTVLDFAGNIVTTLSNNTTYHLVDNGTNLRIIN